MPQKRPYVPKTKGCYECSQRRIHCDRNVPSCLKCRDKGLKCSGLSLRHRFNDGVASRGKWAGRTMEDIYRHTGSETADTQARCQGSLVPQPLPFNIAPWKRMLLVHFSDHIAQEMVVIDGLHNGWRYLALPVAQTDELVMDAVLAVSATHSYLKPDQYVQGYPDTHGLYTRAIAGLQNRSLNQSTQESILLTILILLIGVMVTGNSDFPILIQMLQSAFDVVGREDGLGNGELAGFIVRQVHKMLVYAAPLLSEEKGFATLSSPWRIAQFFDCINHCAQHRPEHASTVSIVRDILQQARGIYLQQTDAEISIQRVQRFIDTLQAFPPNSPGEQVLIWASFIAASDCLLDEHKAFFERTFQRHHARNGFSNLPRGVDHLHEIWARNPSDKWASLLPHARLFIM